MIANDGSQHGAFGTSNVASSWSWIMGTISAGSYEIWCWDTFNAASSGTTVSDSLPADNSSPITIGARRASGGTYSDFLYGYVAEVRISNVKRSNAYREACANNQLFTAFWSLSSETFIPPPPDAQHYYSVFTVQASQITGTVTDLPVLVNWTDVRFKSVSNGGYVASGAGYDLIPYTSAALTTRYAFEVEKYAPTTGEIVYWVKIPSAAVGSQIFFGYGDTSIITSQATPAGVWTDYQAVYHFGHNGTGVDADLSDSSGNGYTWSYDSQPPDGASFFGYSLDSIEINNGSTGGKIQRSAPLGVFTSQNFTFTCKLSLYDSNPGSIGAAIPIGAGTYQGTGWYLGVDAAGGIGVTLNKSGVATSTNSNTGVCLDYLHHGSVWSPTLITFVRNGTVGKIYVNGVDVTASSDVLVDPDNHTGGIRIGGYLTSSSYDSYMFIDEIRFRYSATTAAFEQAHFNTMTSSSFWALGSQQTVSAGASTEFTQTFIILG
jgi:hypothetical protein